MTIQYNVPIKVLDSRQEWRIQNSLAGYSCFVDDSGNLDRTIFSREQLPYVGDIIVIKTLKKEVVDTAHKVLSGIEGLIVLPTTECSWEEDIERIKIVNAS